MKRNKPYFQQSEALILFWPGLSYTLVSLGSTTTWLLDCRFYSASLHITALQQVSIWTSLFHHCCVSTRNGENSFHTAEAFVRASYTSAEQTALQTKALSKVSNSSHIELLGFSFQIPLSSTSYQPAVTIHQGSRDGGDGGGGVPR